MVTSWERAGMDKDTIVVGDFILNSSEWDSEIGKRRRLMETVNNKVVTKGFIEVINEGTHRAPNRVTMIEYEWRNFPRILIEVGVTFNGDFDHTMIREKI